MWPYLDTLKTEKLKDWDPGGTLAQNDQLQTEAQPLICQLDGMAGCLDCPWLRKWVGIRPPSDPKLIFEFLGPRHCSKSKTNNIIQELSAPGSQIYYWGVLRFETRLVFRLNLIVSQFVGVPVWAIILPSLTVWKRGGVPDPTGGTIFLQSTQNCRDV